METTLLGCGDSNGIQNGSLGSRNESGVGKPEGHEVHSNVDEIAISQSTKPSITQRVGTCYSGRTTLATTHLTQRTYSSSPKSSPSRFPTLTTGAGRAIGFLCRTGLFCGLGGGVG